MITSESVWNNCLKFIKDNIQIQAYKTWFEPIKPIKFEDNILSVQDAKPLTLIIFLALLMI